MVKSCANKITSFLIYNKTIKGEECNLYTYAFETLIAFIINIIVILFVGDIFNKLNETILFLLCYCPIRQFTGGYHADNYKKCLLVFILIYISNIFFIDILMYSNVDKLIMIVMIVSYTGIYFLTPLEHRSKPLSKKEKKNYKKIALYLTSIVLLFSMIGINFKITYEYSIYTASVIIWIFIMLNLGIIKNLRSVNI